MSTQILENRIDFLAVITVDGANPNGDPLAENEPRIDSFGYGEISDVCIKHKLRNRLATMYMENPKYGNEVLIQSAMDDKSGRPISLSDRIVAKEDVADIVFGGFTDLEKTKALCNTWIDVRAFGYLAAMTAPNSYKLKKKKEKGEDGTKEKGLSLGIRGPVSVMTAKSIAQVSPRVMKITKCISTVSKDDKSDEKRSDTMGTKYYIDRAAYVLKGSINIELAERNGFTEDDANAVKQAILTLFYGDQSAARPAGSMEVAQLYWFQHNNKLGQYSYSKVFNSIEISPSDSYPYFQSEFHQDKIPGLTPEIIQNY